MSATLGWISRTYLYVCSVAFSRLTFLGPHVSNKIVYLYMQNKLVTVSPDTKVLRAMELMTGINTKTIIVFGPEFWDRWEPPVLHINCLLCLAWCDMPLKSSLLQIVQTIVSGTYQSWRTKKWRVWFLLVMWSVLSWMSTVKNCSASAPTFRVAIRW